MRNNNNSSAQGISLVGSLSEISDSNPIAGLKIFSSSELLTAHYSVDDRESTLFRSAKDLRC